MMKLTLFVSLFLAGSGCLSRLHAQQTKTWNFSAMNAGDCQIKDMHLVIRSDGTGHFDSNIKTFHTHTGDYWHIRFVFTDQNQQNGFVIPIQPIEFNSGRLNDEDPFRAWDFDFIYAASHFGPANFASIAGEC
jgi:hypothetical protein